MDKPTVYLETSVISYLTSRYSRDLLVTAHQEVSHRWWEAKSNLYNIFISQSVIQEISLGDPEQIQKRLDLVKDLELLKINEDVLSIARTIKKAKLLPEKATEDIFHIAISTAHNIDYLLTWNCKHIANIKIQKQLRALCASIGFNLSYIGTPLELLGE